MTDSCGNEAHPDGPWHMSDPLATDIWGRLAQRSRRRRWGCGCRSMTGDRVLIYRDKAGDFRWRRVAANNEVIASGEAHDTQRDAIRAARRANGEEVELRVEGE